MKLLSGIVLIVLTPAVLAWMVIGVKVGGLCGLSIKRAAVVATMPAVQLSRWASKYRG